MDRTWPLRHCDPASRLDQAPLMSVWPDLVSQEAAPIRPLVPTPYFEPLFAAKHADLPRYDEQFRGYGLNKVQFTDLLAALGRRFVSHRDAFAVAPAHDPSEARIRSKYFPLDRCRTAAIYVFWRLALEQWGADTLARVSRSICTGQEHYHTDDDADADGNGIDINMDIEEVDFDDWECLETAAMDSDDVTPTSTDATRNEDETEASVVPENQIPGQRPRIPSRILYNSEWKHQLERALGPSVTLQITWCTYARIEVRSKKKVGKESNVDVTFVTNNEVVDGIGYYDQRL
jgi:hypothetical protein